MIGLGENQIKLKKNAPEGTSLYQAEWIMAEDGDWQRCDESEDESNDEMNCEFQPLDSDEEPPTEIIDTVISWLMTYSDDVTCNYRKA